MDAHDEMAAASAESDQQLCGPCLVYIQGHTLEDASQGLFNDVDQVALHVVGYEDAAARRGIPLSPPGHVADLTAWAPGKERIAYTHYPQEGGVRLSIAELEANFPQYELSVSAVADDRVDWLAWVDATHLMFSLTAREDPALLHMVTLTRAELGASEASFASFAEPVVEELPGLMTPRHILKAGKGVVVQRVEDSHRPHSPCYLFTPDQEPPLRELATSGCDQVGSDARGNYISIVHEADSSSSRKTASIFATSTVTKLPIELPRGHWVRFLWGPSSAIFAYSWAVDEYVGDVGAQVGGFVFGDAAHGSLTDRGLWGGQFNGLPGDYWTRPVGFLDDSTLLITGGAVGEKCVMVPVDATQPMVNLVEEAGQFALRSGRLITFSETEAMLIDTELDPGAKRALNHDLAPGEEIGSVSIERSGRYAIYSSGFPESDNQAWTLHLADLEQPGAPWPIRVSGEPRVFVVDWTDNPQGLVVHTQIDGIGRLYWTNLVGTQATQWAAAAYRVSTP